MADNKYNADVDRIENQIYDTKSSDIPDTMDDEWSKKIQQIRRKSGVNDDASVIDLMLVLNRKDNKKLNRNEVNQGINNTKNEILAAFEDADFSSESNRVSRYNDYRLVDKYIPEIATAIDVFANSIQSPDDTSKLSMNVVNTAETDENRPSNITFKNKIDKIIEDYDLERKISTSIRDGLLLGDTFFIVKSLKEEMASILSEDDDELFESEDGEVDLTGGEILSESHIEDYISKNRTLSEFIKEFAEDHEKDGNITEDSIKKDIKNSINDNVLFYENPMDLLSDTGKYRKSKSIKNMIRSDQIKIKDSAFVKMVEPEDIVKLEIDGMCIGYIYIEPDSGADIKGPGNPALRAMASILGNGYDSPTQNNTPMGHNDHYFNSGGGGGLSNNGKNPRSPMNATSGTWYENGNTAMQYDALVDMFVKGIGEKVDKDFLNKNSAFKEIIFRLMRKNYIIEKEVSMTFLKPNEVFHHKLDSDKTYGKSKIINSLFFAKLYLSTLITSIMVKINHSRDRRVFYVDTGLDNDIEGTIQEVIRNVRQQDVSNSIFNDDESLSTALRPMGAHENYYIPRQGGTTPLEIDTISGMQVDIEDQFLEWLKKSVMAGTGVPFSYIDASQETDYARSLSMQNNSFVRRVIAYQHSFGKFLSDIIGEIYMIENPDENKILKENIQVQFPAPTFLNLQNTNEHLNFMKDTLEYYANMFYKDEEEDEKHAFMIHLAKKKFGTAINLNEIEEIKDEVNKEIAEQKLNNNESEDDDDGGF